MNKALMIFILLFPFTIISQNWTALGSGTNGQVFALSVYNNELIAGGSFTTAGGITVNRIAKWNGTSWSALGTGMNNVVYALCVYNNELIAAGYFTAAGGNSAGHIAKWNGVSWQPLGGGTNDYITSLAVYNNQLIAGGVFSTAGGVNTLALARWNGSNWLELNTGVNNPVRSLAVFNNELYIGGDFTSPYQHVTRWNGSTLLDIPYGARGDVLALSPSPTSIIIGGAFSIAGNGQANCIISWNGTGWNYFGSGMNFLVNSVLYYQGMIIAGGQFTTAGGTTVNRIAKYTNQWISMNGGMNGAVTALVEYNGDLIAGGNYSNAGTTPANNIAKWHEFVGIIKTNENIPEKYLLEQNFPNPFNPVTKIKFFVAQQSFVTISIYDGLGREISSIVKQVMLPGTYETSFDASEFTSGVYYYRMTAGTYTEIKKMVLIK